MTEWLKFYFLGFFSPGLTRQAGDRRFANVLLSFLLLLVLVFTGLFAGHLGSFSKHLGESGEFLGFVSSAFDGGEISLNVTGGKMKAEIAGADSITPYGGKNYSKNGYALVVDTRPAATYDDFSVTVKNSEGGEIAYERYFKMTEAARAGYTVNVVYSLNPLDYAANNAIYVDFLTGEECAADVKTAYDELKNKCAAGEVDEAERLRQTYVLYVKGYYPDLPKDRFGDAPTVRAGEVEKVSKDFDGKYLMIFDNLCMCRFETDKGVRMDFDGYFSSFKDGNPLTNGAAEFIKSAFSTGGGVNFVIYFLNTLTMIPYFLMIYAIAVLVVFAAGRIGKFPSADTILKAMKVVGSFLLISAVLTFLIAITLSFFIERSSAFTFTIVSFAAIFALRALAFVICEIVDGKINGDAQTGVAEETAE